MAESMPIDAEPGIQALSDLGLEAVELFHKVEKSLKELADEAWPEDIFVSESQRFELWAANIGLFVPGHGSLDYRVREAEKLAQTLRRFMLDLVNSLDDVVQMCTEANEESAPGVKKSSAEELATQTPLAEAKDENAEENMDEDEDKESLDMDLLVDSVRDPINRLFKMSTKIRNPSTRLGSSRAANFRQVDEETGVDFLQAMKEFDLDYVKTMFLEYRKTKARRESQPAQAPGGPAGENDDEVWEPLRTVLSQEQEREGTGAESYLIERIAQANVRRRQQFAYWARHRDKLDTHAKAYQAQKERLQTTQRQKGGDLGLELAPAAVPSVTTATRLDIAQLEIASDTRSNWTFSEYAPSTRQAADAPVDFPPPPKIPHKRQTDKFFECPYCFFLCPKDIRAEKAWKAHLIHDLRPYICTYKHCRNPTQLYDSRKDWVQHENSEHRKVWRCLEHSNEVFESLETYRHHLQEQHAGSISGEASLTRIIQASESVSDVAKRTCPICTVELDTGRAMDGHIALHLERFARFTLPRSVINDDDGSNADSGKANRVDEEGSRDDDFEGDFELRSDMGSSENQTPGHPPEVGSPDPPYGAGATGDIPQDAPASDDDDESSSESARSHREVEQPGNDETTFDGVELGKWCTDFEKYEKAEQHLKELLEEAEKTLGSDHPDTWELMEKLVELLRGQMKFAEAEERARNLLELKEKVLGHEHPSVWKCMDKVSVCLYDQEKYAEAEKIDRGLLVLREKALGREDPETVLTLSNLGATISYLGQLEEAEKLGREAMEFRKKVLGPSHLDTLMSMGTLAYTLKQMGRLDEAEQLRRESLESHRKVLGPAHVDTLMEIHNLAHVLDKLGQLDEAEQLGREVIESRKTVLGPSHFETVLSMSNLADVLEQMGRLDEAERLWGEVIEIRKQKLGVDHPDTLSSIRSKAKALWIQGRFEEAGKLEMEVLEASRQTLGSTHPDTLRTMYALAHTWHSQGRMAEAIDLMEECFQLRRQALGPDDQETLNAAEKLEEWRAEQAAE